MIVWIIWFTITGFAGTIVHIPIDQEFTTRDACMEAAETTWIPLLVQQFPNDEALTVVCEKRVLPRVKI